MGIRNEIIKVQLANDTASTILGYSAAGVPETKSLPAVGRYLRSNNNGGIIAGRFKDDVHGSGDQSNFSLIEAIGTSQGLAIESTDLKEYFGINKCAPADLADGGALSETAVASFFTVLENSVIDITIHVSGIKTDNTQSFALKRRALFRKISGAMVRDAIAAAELLESTAGIVTSSNITDGGVSSIGFQIQLGVGLGAFRVSAWSEFKVLQR